MLERVMNGDVRTVGLSKALQRLRKVVSTETYTRLLCATFVVPMQRELSGPKFDPLAPESTVLMMEAWRPVLTDEMAEIFFERVLVPALVKTAERWSTKMDVDPHGLLFPWLPILGKKNIASLFSYLSHRFGKSLNQTEGWDEVVTAVSPWKSVLKENTFRTFAMKYVAPLLEKRVEEELVIDPSGERENQVDVLDDVRQFGDLVGWEGAGQVLYASFFPKWLRILRKWLQNPEADGTEISAWYQNWTQIFSPELRSSRLVRAGLHVALDLMRARFKGEGVDHLDVKEMLASRYRSTVGEKKKEEEGVKTVQATRSTGGGTVSASVRDVILREATLNGIHFAPSAQRSERVGRKVYMFGTVPVYFDNTKDIVYAQRDAKTEFEPIHVAELLELYRERVKVR